MIIACPRCGTPYAVEEAVFGPRPRVVQCSGCECRWTQQPEATASTEPALASTEKRPEIESADSWERPEPDEDVDEVASTQHEPDTAAADTVRLADDEPTETSKLDAEPSAYTIDDDAAMDGEATAADGEDRDDGDDAESSDDAMDAKDTDIAAAPQQPERRKTGVIRAKRLSGARSLVMIVAAVATVIALSALLIAARGPIIAAVPASAGIYRTLGLGPDTLGAGLEIRDVTGARKDDRGEHVLTVTGLIANVIDQPAPIPIVRVSLFDAAGQELQFVTLPSRQHSLAAGETLPFEAQINEPSPHAKRIRVRFVPASSS
jgi:predicted Zn finger-like uncharacterized protein